MKSKFIVVEGLEGSGKSSAVKYILKILQHHGVSKLITTRDPGGTKLSEKLRFLIKNGIDNELITNYAELLMFYAARVQLIETIIKPALLNDVWVIGDRYDLSSQAYQGGGRKINKELLHILYSMVLNKFSPDLTFYLDVSPEVGLSRVYDRNKKLDRIEMESLDFFNRTRLYYQLLANKDDTVISIDANQKLSSVHNDIYFYFQKWFINLII